MMNVERPLEYVVEVMKLISTNWHFVKIWLMIQQINQPMGTMELYTLGSLHSALGSLHNTLGS